MKQPLGRGPRLYLKSQQSFGDSRVYQLHSYRSDTQRLGSFLSEPLVMHSGNTLCMSRQVKDNGSEEVDM